MIFCQFEFTDTSLNLYINLVLNFLFCLESTDTQYNGHIIDMTIFSSICLFHMINGIFIPAGIEILLYVSLWPGKCHVKYSCNKLCN